MKSTQGLRISATIRRAITVFVVALLICVAHAASAQDSKALLGAWYGEEAGRGTFDGKQYDFRRWLSDQRADGTGQTQFRYYAGNRVVADFVEEFAWGIENGVYWERCISTTVSGTRGSCSHQSRYPIDTLNQRELIYRNAAGKTYRQTKVSSDFRLP